MSTPYFRLAFTLIGIGCSLAVVLVLAVLGMDILHLQGDLEAMTALSVVYDVAVVGAMAFLCAGLALPPLARMISRRRQSKTEATLIGRLAEVWEKTTDLRPEVRLLPLAKIEDRRESMRWRLHRMVVEIQDALLIDPELSRVLDDRDHQVLNRVERYLAAPSSRKKDRRGPHTVGRGEHGL